MNFSKKGTIGILVVALTVVILSVVGCSNSQNAHQEANKGAEASISATPKVKYVKSENTSNKDLEQAIKKALNATNEDYQKTRYYYNYVDLNDDNNPEVFVQLVGPYTSGTGGDTGMIFTQKDGQFKLFQEFTLIRNPIIISNSTTNGWHDLIIEAYGGGTEYKYNHLKFSGQQYPNTSSAEKLTDLRIIEGKGIINNDIGEDFQAGKGLYLAQ